MPNTCMPTIVTPYILVQYCFGRLQETTDHLLYPNPGSAMVHEQHLQFFHFLGTLLAKVYVFVFVFVFDHIRYVICLFTTKKQLHVGLSIRLQY